MLVNYVCFIAVIALDDAETVTDMCDGRHASTTKLWIYGEKHCLFEPPNQQEVVKQNPQTKGYEFKLDYGRQLCRKYEAGLLQFRDQRLFWEVVEKAKGEPSVYHPLGVKHLENYTEPGPLVPERMKLLIKVTWDSGESTVIDTYKIFGKERLVWYEPHRDGMTVLNHITGTLHTVDPEKPIGLIALLCHQDPEHPVASAPGDVCASSAYQSEVAPRDRKYPPVDRSARFEIAGKWHCIFQPLNESHVLKKIQLDYKFTLDDLRQYCRKFDAALLQIRNAEIYDAIRKATEKLFGNALQSYPLGITKKIVIKGTPPPIITGLRVTWDNGVTMESPHWKAFGNVTWDTSPGGGAMSFLQLPDPRIIVQDPAQLQGPIVILCHQDPRAPGNYHHHSHLPERKPDKWKTRQTRHGIYSDRLVDYGALGSFNVGA